LAPHDRHTIDAVVGGMAPVTEHLSDIDSGTQNLTVADMTTERCEEFAFNMTSEDPGTPAALVHTGITVKPGDAADVERKWRLGALSFLVTQAPNASMNIWVEPALADAVSRALEPVLRLDRAKRIALKQFDATREFNAAFPGDQARADSLAESYGRKWKPASKSDLSRSVLLHNYGGMWIDTDVVLLRSLAPVVGVDFAYLGQDDFINNAVLGTSGPRSPFMRAYLDDIEAEIKSLAGQHPNGRAADASIYAFGPESLKRLWQQSRSNSTMHVLLGCFFDGGWVPGDRAVPWDAFFTGNATEKQVQYFTPGSGIHGTFAYHWHGRWDQPIAQQSVAARFEAACLHALGAT